MTTILLRDIPGFPQFARQLTDSVAELSLALAGENYEATLEQTRINLAKNLTKDLGAEAATELADAFVAAVAGRRREIAAGPTPGALN